VLRDEKWAISPGDSLYGLLENPLSDLIHCPLFFKIKGFIFRPFFETSKHQDKLLLLGTQTRKRITVALPLTTSFSFMMIFTNLDLVLSRKSRVAKMRTMKSKIPNKKTETEETTRVKADVLADHQEQGRGGVQVGPVPSDAAQLHALGVLRHPPWQVLGK
jgi:hypothetical protein